MITNSDIEYDFLRENIGKLKKEDDIELYIVKQLSPESKLKNRILKIQNSYGTLQRNRNLKF